MSDTEATADLILKEDADWAFVGPRTTFFSRDELLRAVVPMAYKVPGDIVEFGVANGESTRVIRRTANKMEKLYGSEAKKRIFACDSFEGLPEKYENAEVGTFACDPPQINGVEIVKGYFEDSLTGELAKKVGRVALASLDADLYSSTLCALNWLTPLLGSGSLLLFDELLGEKEAEKKALEDWSNETGMKSIMIGYFLRDPSAWGESIDARALYQIVGDEPLQRNQPKPNLKGKVVEKLRDYPALQTKLRGIYHKLRGE